MPPIWSIMWRLRRTWYPRPTYWFSMDSYSDYSHIALDANFCFLKKRKKKNPLQYKIHQLFKMFWNKEALASNFRVLMCISEWALYISVSHHGNIFFLTENSTFVHHSVVYSNWTHFAAHQEKWKWRVTSKAFIHHFILFWNISSFKHSQDHLLYEPVVTSLLTNRHNWPNPTTAPKVRRLWPLFPQTAVNF